MSLLSEFLYDIWVRKALSAAGHTVLVYDYFLSLNDEIQYIWSAPWTIVKVMFLINRYGNLVGQTVIRLEEAGVLAVLAHNSQLFCQRFAIVTNYFMVLSSESIHILVLMRAWAIWGTRKRLTNILVGSYVIYVLILLGITMLGGIHDSHENFRYLNLVEICVSDMPKYMWLGYFGSVILDAVTFVLTVRSLWRYSREFQFLYPSNLLRVLLRDATIFFVISMFNNSIIVASWTVYANSPYTFLPKGFSGPLLSVVGQRVVLNLKSLPTRTYATHELSREVDRQLEVFEFDECCLSPQNRCGLDDAKEACCSSPQGRDGLDVPEGGIRECQPNLT
ncbi:uncharacterized protein EDB93DRAFT_1154904 [Suillus bovinus]|uniref:uncharacterized protein n=1 Tax=Suillus bovinus TaxID=48563 RepID=UPI001B876DC0|nr:uncharacterized protein EDB93DRAFT_1154904 [Suillus bovinus]KAG2143807.1 hypothetical protein EDB93DRAFT_1154904 [Suillus bovinus]